MNSDCPKNLLIVLYYYHPYVSGLSLLAKMQAEGLVRRGYRVTVLTTQHEKSLPRSEFLNGVHVVRAKVLAKAGKGVVSWEFLRAIVRLAKLHDIVNPHLPMAHLGVVLPFIDTRKLVPQYHCDLNLGSGVMLKSLERISYWSMNKVLQRASKIIVTTRDYFSNSRFAAYDSRACEIYPPIDAKRFGQVSSFELRQRLAIHGNTKLIGFVGRVVAEKGLGYLLQAIPLLQKRLDDFLILIAGEYTDVAGGSVKKEVDRLVEQFPGRVRFLGHLKFADLVAFYNLIDVLVLPSVDPLEAFGMVQVEAMLCGTPVIATDMPGVREVVRKTGFGRLVKIRDPEDIADKIVELLNAPMVCSPDRLAVFDYEQSIDRYERVFAMVHDQNK